MSVPSSSVSTALREGGNKQKSVTRSFTYRLAPVYLDPLASHSAQIMDDGLKASVAAVTHVLSTFPSSELSWESVLREMSQNALVESDGPEGYTRTELVNDQGVPFSLQDSQTIYNNLVNLVKDGDVLDATSIKREDITALIATARADVESSSDMTYTAGLDAGVLRYPDITKPYYKVYCIKLDVWSITAPGAAENGITCEYRCQNFRLCTAIVKERMAEVQDSAVKEAEKLFG